MISFPDTSFLFALYRAQDNSAVDSAHVLRIAERLSAAHTKTGGHRALEVLHIATATVLEAEEFLSFDSNQRKLAAAEGFRARP